MGIYDFVITSYLIHGSDQSAYSYKIYSKQDVIKGEDWFDTAQEARFAAIGHITLLEKGLA